MMRYPVAYYAMLDAARSALLTKNVYPKSHAGAVHQFHRVFIKSLIIPDEFGKMLSRAEQSREEAEYEYTKPFSESDATKIISRLKSSSRPSEN